MSSQVSLTRTRVWRPSRRESWVILGLSGSAVALLFFLYVIPVPHAIAFRQSSAPEGTAYAFDPPSGSLIECAWSTGHGPPVYLSVVDSLGNLVYASWSTNGSFSFTAGHPPYTVSALGSFQITGEFYSPTL